MKTIAIAITLVLCLGAMGLSQIVGPAPAAEAAGKKQPAGVNPKGILTKDDFRKILLNNKWEWKHPDQPKGVPYGAMSFLENGTFAVNFKDVGKYDIVDTKTVRIHHPKGNFSSKLEFNGDYTSCRVTQSRGRLFVFDCKLL
jgi:hypothetical protein